MAITYPTTLDAFTNPTALDLLTSPSHATQHADINDAVEALEAKVAIGNTVLGTYTAFTPSVTGVTLGNGTVSARYCQVNKYVHYWGRLAFGSTSSLSGGTINLAIPVLMQTTFGTGTTGLPGGQVSYFDASASNWYKGEAMTIAANDGFRLRSWVASGTAIVNTALSASAPFTWTTSDQIMWNLYYEAA